MKSLKLDSRQRYFNEETGAELRLCFDDHELVVGKIRVCLNGVPLLKDSQTNEVFFPDKTKLLIEYFVTEGKKENKGLVNITPKPRDVRYPFAEKFDFKYSHIDFEFIPGLVRPWETGFLTPVFFNLAVINKYSQHPDYKLDLVSETYGTIYKGDEWYISFGITNSKKAIMWLGDIDKLPEPEIYYLRSENIDSDHDIHSEFYTSQIEAEFSDSSLQTSAFHARKTLSDLISEKFNFNMFMLSGEVSEILSNLDKPVFWEDKHISTFVESLNRIFVESINPREIKKHLKSINSDIDLSKLRGLKLLQTWLGECIKADSPESIMLPFFVLYDFRVYCSHLLPAEKREKLYYSICNRLNLDATKTNYEEIYENIMNKILSSYETIIEIANPNR